MTTPWDLDRIGERIYANDYPEPESDGEMLNTPEFPGYPASRRVHAWELDNR